MTRAFIPIPDGTGITGLENGGALKASSDEVYVPELLGVTDDQTGVTLGPLQLEIPEGGGLALDSLTFAPGDEPSSGFLAATVVATPLAATDEETTRRGALTFMAALLGAATMATTTTADDTDLVTLRVAEFEIADITAPATVTLVDIVDAVLPPSAEVLIDQQNARVGKIADAGEGVTLRQTTGPVRVYIRDTLGRLAQLLAWAKSFLPSDASLTYRRPFPDGKSATDFDPDEFVRLTSHPSIVSPIEAADEGRTILSVGGDEAPHSDDGGNSIGSWSLLDGTLIYEVGDDPPDADEWEVTTRLSAWQSFQHERL